MENNDVEIPVRYGPAIYATYQRLSYRIDNAIYEFIDNSTQNFFDKILKHKPSAKLNIHINWDRQKKQLVIRDDAHGMELEEFKRAILLNQPPPDRTGRSEYGMGLKMAACWLSNRWKVVSKQAGSPTEYSVDVDVQKLSSDNPDSILVTRKALREEETHYTRIELNSVIRQIRANTVTQIKNRIAATYRRDIESGSVSVYWNQEKIEYENPYRVPMVSIFGDEEQAWEKTLQFDVTSSGATTLPVKGTVWVGATGSYRNQGIDIFRRGRMVLGNAISQYKPQEIYGASNSSVSLRLGMELDLDEWPASTNKDAILWGAPLYDRPGTPLAPTETEFLDALKANISEYIQQARKPLSRIGDDDDEGTTPSETDGKLASDTVKADFSNPEMDNAIMIMESVPLPDEEHKKDEDLFVKEQVEDLGTTEPIDVKIGQHGVPTFKTWWKELDSMAYYVEYAMPQDDEVHLIVNSNHPFVTNHIGVDPALLSAYLRSIISDVQTEISLRKRGTDVPANSFRILKDQLLRSIEKTVD